MTYVGDAAPQRLFPAISLLKMKFIYDNAEAPPKMPSWRM
jgi:hypothetical protein